MSAPSKEQVVHDLAMACVNGIVQDKVIKENKRSDYGLTSATDIVIDVIMAYKDAWDMIYPQIDISDN